MCISKSLPKEVRKDKFSQVVAYKNQIHFYSLIKKNLKEKLREHEFLGGSDGTCL